MIKEKSKSLTIIIPARNSETTLESVLNSVEKQDYPISKVYILDNNSSDRTVDIARKFKQKSKLPIEIIIHKKDMGLSYSYNEALAKVKTPLVITLQSDSVIIKKNGISSLIKPFLKDKNIVATCSLQTTPWSVWKKYNFWQKCLFSRFAGKILSGRNGRFCCYSSVALKNIGYFNTKLYRTAGEDGDLFFRLQQIGKVVDINTVADHLHSMSDNFSLKDYIYKENQLAEASGATLANNIKRASVIHWATVIFRPILILGILIPRVNIVFFLLIMIYVIYYTKDVFVDDFWNWRTIILPFINLYILFSFTFFFIRGVIRKRQVL